MSYTALYRKFRPATFDEVKGQDPIVKTLTNQIKADRMGHAYLFCGTRGTGKTSVAKIFAKAVNCEHPVNGNPCNECPSCRAIAAGSSMNVIEIDAASNNGVDDVRQIREEVAYSPTEGRFKVYIIDEVHMLSNQAFNALLKTLEEPPSYVIFILATTEVQRIPVTILSRCQRYDFHRIPQDTILARLQELTAAEQVDAEEKALRYIARKGDGSLRDAVSLLDQCIAFYLGETLTYDRALEVLGAVDTDVYSDMLRKILRDDVAGVIRSLESLIRQGRDLTQFVSDFTWYLRNLLLLKSSDDMEDVLDVSTENLARLREEGAMIHSDTLMRDIRILSELSGAMRFSTNKRVQVEMALIKLCKPESEHDEISLAERIRKLEAALEQIQSAGLPVYGSALQGYAGAPGLPPHGEAERDAGGGSYEESTVPLRAAPEDLKKICGMWKKIVGATSGRMLQVLSDAVPKYNAQDERDTKLYVELARGSMADRFPEDENRTRELERLIAEQTGIQVEVKFVLAQDEGPQKGGLTRIEIDEIVREQIHMEVEIEEDGNE